tara:strand:+ start:836 stop:1231 length:396 start_codon:yes stop_codon:yes gene_type:complete
MTNENKEEIKIKLRKGNWEVEITCSEEQVKQSVEGVLAGINSSPLETAIESRVIKPKPSLTCRNLLERLWNDEWFVEEKTLAEVHEELARIGYHYDRTAVSHSLTDLVRESILTRIGSMRSYRYIQKRPPQ